MTGEQIDPSHGAQSFKPFVITDKDSQCFAEEVALLSTTDTAMVQDNVMRYLLGSHLLSEQPSEPDNNWRVGVSNTPEILFWHPLPSVAVVSTTGQSVAKGKVLPSKGSHTTKTEDNPKSHNNLPAQGTISRTFWLSITGLKATWRNAFCTYVQSPTRSLVCPYLGIEYCSEGSAVARVLERLVLTGSHALYDRLMLADKAHAVAQDEEAFSYFGIFILHDKYHIYRLATKRPVHTYHQGVRSHLQSASPTTSIPTPKPHDSQVTTHTPLHSRLSTSSAHPVRLTSQAPSTAPAVPWPGATVDEVCRGSCRDKQDLLGLVAWINAVHAWGQGAHARSVCADMEACFAADFGLKEDSAGCRDSQA